MCSIIGIHFSSKAWNFCTSYGKIHVSPCMSLFLTSAHSQSLLLWHMIPSSCKRINILLSKRLLFRINSSLFHQTVLEFLNCIQVVHGSNLGFCCCPTILKISPNLSVITRTVHFWKATFLSHSCSDYQP